MTGDLQRDNPGLNEISADPLGDDRLLTLKEAAEVARRSVRTLERAYRQGGLEAYRDGNGRGVSIEYRDLRAWMKRKRVRARTVAATLEANSARGIPSPIRPRSSRLEENLRLLKSASARHR